MTSSKSTKVGFCKEGIDKLEVKSTFIPLLINEISRFTELITVRIISNRQNRQVNIWNQEYFVDYVRLPRWGCAISLRLTRSAVTTLIQIRWLTLSGNLSNHAGSESDLTDKANSAFGRLNGHETGLAHKLAQSHRNQNLNSRIINSFRSIDVTKALVNRARFVLIFMDYDLLFLSWWVHGVIRRVHLCKVAGALPPQWLGAPVQKKCTYKRIFKKKPVGLIDQVQGF